jgi:enoyl-[acyl-carrier protein] reductase I
MPHGGCLLTFTFHGGQKVVPHYDLMGPVKAALEASVRSMAAELGSDAARLVTGNVEFVDAGFHVMG